MTFQYSLRFESSERRGEVVPLTAVAARGGSFTIGRKPGNSLQVTDVSVSGQHAELEVTEDGVSLRDLNSTNGTQVGGRKVRLTSLEPGDEFMLGAVEFTLLSGDGAAASAPASDDGGIDVEEFVLEDPDAPAAAPMPRKAPKAVPKAAPAEPAPAKARRKVAPAPVSAPADLPPVEGLGETKIQPVEDTLEITAADLERSAKSSKVGPLVLVALAAAGGGAFWWTKGRTAEEEGGSARAAQVAPTPPAGNLLTAGYSFEKSDGWFTDPDAPTAFEPTRSASRSGVRGIQADLVGGQSALIESDPLRVPDDARSFKAAGFAMGDGGVDLRLGLRYSSDREPGEDTVSTVVWSDSVSLTEEFGEFSLVGTAPRGLGYVQVVVRAECTDAPPEVSAAEGEGSDEEDESFASAKFVAVDDVSLVAEAGAPAATQLDGMTVTTIAGASASDARGLAVTSLDRVLVPSLRVLKSSSAAGAASLQTVALSTAPSDGGVTATPGGAGTLVLRTTDLLASAGIATLSDAGYASHGSTFERDGVTTMLIGGDMSMVSVRFARAVKLTARATNGGVTFRAAVGAGDAMTIQTKFMEERTLAHRLARRAKEELSGGDSGAALATWNELLSTVPYEMSVVQEAITGQSEVLAEGRSELKGLAAQVERARFFGLADLYREKLDRANDLATRFRGSDVESDAIALRDTIAAELAKMDVLGGAHESQRLQAISTVLKRRGAGTLASRVESYLAGDSPNGSGPGADSSPSNGGGN